MLWSWVQALSLVLLILNVRRIEAVNWGALGSEIDNKTKSAASSISGEASQLVGDLENEFQIFENAVESELSKALADSDGVLAQFTMDYQTYATDRVLGEWGCC
jgi:hypothetical protein